MAFNVDYIINLRDKATVKLGLLDKKAKGVNTSFGALGGTMATVFSTGLIVAGISKSIKAFDRQEQALAQVRTGLESTGNTAGKTLEGLQKTAQNFQKTTIFGDEDILTGVTSQLLTFTNIAGEQFDRTQKAALDVTSRLFGVDASAESLRSTSIQLGKALNDPTANMGALSRSGIQFSAQQKEVIKNLQKTGNLAGAQTIILDELEKQYGGSAEAAAKAGAGGLKQFNNQMGDIVEEIGGFLLPIISKMANTFLKFIDFVKRNSTAFKVFAVILGVVGAAFLAYRASIVLTRVSLLAMKAISNAFFLIDMIKYIASTQGLTFAQVVLGMAQKALNAIMLANPIGLIILAIAALIAIVVVVVKNYDEWGASLTFLLGPLGMVINLVQAFRRNWDDLKKTFSEGSILDGLKKIGAIMIDSMLMPLQQLLELASKLPGVGDLAGKGAAKIEALRKRMGINTDPIVVKEVKEGSLAGIGDEATKNAALAAAIASGKSGVGKGLDSGISGVTSSAPKTFNINIDALVKEFKISTTNMAESVEKTKDLITQALITAVNDVSIIDK